MKDLFPGYFIETNEARKTWDECIFVFDANVICNLYRYSDETKDLLIKVLNKLKERVWMPNRAAEEFLRNRPSIIAEQEKYYSDAKRDIDKMISELSQKRKHPFVREDLLEKFKAISEEVKSELDVNKKNYSSRINDDDLKWKVSDIFEGAVGRAFNKEMLNKIFKEGEGRYKEKVPPGYEDAKKDDGTFKGKYRAYGDLVIWKQLLDKAKEDDVNVVFVTGDEKSDWWLKEGNLTLGPRPELIEEFKNIAGKDILIYKADKFLELALDHLGMQIDENALNEIKQVKDVQGININDVVIKNSSHSRAADAARKISLGMIYVLEKQLSDCKEEILNLERVVADLNEYRDTTIFSADAPELFGEDEWVKEIDNIEKEIKRYNHNLSSLKVKKKQIESKIADKYLQVL